MNEREQEEERLGRLIRAGFDPAALPDSKTRQENWKRLKAEWGARYGRGAPKQDTSAESVVGGVPDKEAAPPQLSSPAEAGEPSTGGWLKRTENKTKTIHEGNWMMNILSRNRWGFGLGAAACAAAVLLIVAVSTPSARARATDVLARGAQAVAKLTSIHLRGQLRTLPADNFSYINVDNDFYPIELWKQFEPQLKWRVEKPGRVALMDGQQAILYVKPTKTGSRFPIATPSAFDTDWLQQIANLSYTISNELRHAQARGWQLDLAAVTGTDGRPKSVVTVHTRSGLPDDDYLKGKFLENADTRRVYRFDDGTERLEAAQIYLLRGGAEVQIFDLNQIEYDQPMDAGVWQLDLPSDVSWHQQPQKLPDNEQYATMSAEEAARAFFEACARKDWSEVGKFLPTVNERFKEHLGGLELISLGQAFASKSYGGRFVPYEIRLRSEFNLRVSNANPAHRYVITGMFDSKLHLMQDLQWTNQPVLLPDNEVYAKLSPAETATAYFAAASKLDWAEMRKFAPDYDVENDKRQVEAAERQGVDVRAMLPAREVVEAVWSVEHSAFFVKCRMTQLKKWNLALRKDNPARRWQMDGGL